MIELLGLRRKFGIPSTSSCCSLRNSPCGFAGLQVDGCALLTELNLVAIGDPRDADVRDQLAKIMTERGDLKLAAVWQAAADSCRAAAAREASKDVSP